MKNVITFSLRQRQEVRRVQQIARFIKIMILLMTTFGVIQSSLAGDDERSKKPEFYYKPYSEAEIKAVLQRPLSMEDCIRIALAKNIGLRMASRDLARTEALHAGSYGRFLPVLSLEGTRINSLLEVASRDSISRLIESSFENNSNLTGKASLFLPTGATFQYSQDLLREVLFPIDDPKEISRNRSYSFNFTQPLLRGAGPRMARSNFLLTGYDQQIEENSLYNRKLQTVVLVKRVYFNLLLQRELVKINTSAFKRDSILVLASNALIQAKLATRRDALSAEIRVADDRAALLAGQSDYESALDNLKDVLGLPIEATIGVDSTGLDYVKVDLNEQEIVMHVLEQNPSVRSSEVALARTRLAYSVTKNTQLPQLDLVASYASTLQRDLVVNQDQRRTGGWQASLNLNYPLFSREAASRAEEAEIFVAQQEDRVQELKRQITINIRDIVRAVNNKVEQIVAIKRGIEVAEVKLDFATTMFNLGRASNFDITESQEFLLKAQNQYLRILVEYHTKLAILESLTGKPLVTQ